MTDRMPLLRVSGIGWRLGDDDPRLFVRSHFLDPEWARVDGWVYLLRLSRQLKQEMLEAGASLGTLRWMVYP